jgi:hypothetical protein
VVPLPERYHIIHCTHAPLLLARAICVVTFVAKKHLIDNGIEIAVGRVHWGPPFGFRTKDLQIVEEYRRTSLIRKRPTP